MKTTKKLLSLLLVAVMVMTLGIAAFAAGSITIDNVTTDHTYSAYKVLDVDFDASTPDKVVYSIAKTSPWYATVSGADDVFALTEIETDVYSVELKSGATIDDIVAALKAGFTYDEDKCEWTPPSGLDADASKEADDDDEGTITFSGLDYGYYFITSTLGAAVTIDTNNPDKTVIDKNEVPEWDNPDPDDPDDPELFGKVIVENGTKKQENSVNFGESVDFDIAVKTTKCVGTEYVTNYYITDTIADGFTLDLTSDEFLPTVKVNDDITLVKGDDYTVTMTGTNTFTINILWATPVTDTDGKVTGFDTDYKPGDIIHVSYSATLNADGEDVVIGGTGNVNTAKYAYNTLGVGEDDPDEDFPDPDPKTPWSEPKTTKTYTYAVAIQKVDESGVALAGATFATTDFYALKESDGRYYYCENGTTDAVQTFATDANGVLVIKGLAEGDYTFTEASAPAGYNPIIGDIVITAELDECTESTVTAYYDEDGNLTSTETSDSKTYTVGSTTVPVCATVVQNKTGTVLPSTGGIGTTMFYILGCLMLVGATVLLITKKRMSVNN